jgi:anti-sigma B factor antagonist
MSSDDQVIKQTEPIEDGMCIALSGDIDLSRSPVLRHALMQMSGEGHARIVIDLSDVPYMDSSGVATLVEALQAQRKAGGKIVLCGLQPKVQSIFEIARLDMVFTIVDTKQAAAQA